VLRYLRLFGVQLRASTVAAMQYRVEFLVGGLLALFWTSWSIVPILVVFQGRTAVAGWSFEEALVVVGWFTLMKGVLEGAVNPSLSAVVEAIRKGTLDFVLLKPADAQFLVSTARFAPWRAADVLGGLAIFGVLTSAMGAYYYLRVVVHMYMKPDEGAEEGISSPTLSLALGVAAIAVVVIGIGADPLVKLAQVATAILL